jgi:hypothetical protein
MAAGLLAGLQGYEQVAEGPAKRLGEGISGAVDEGLKAYGTTARVRQGDEEGQRSQQRLNMAEQLLPGQLREQAISSDTHALALKEAGQKITRQDDARAFGATIAERMKKKPDAGGYADPKDFQLDLVNLAMKLGNPVHVKEALRDYKLLLDDSETAKQLGGALGVYQDTIRNAATAKSPEERTRMSLDGIAAIYKAFPIGASHPLMKDLNKHTLEDVKQNQPDAVYSAIEKYTQLRVANPSLSASQAWSRAEEGLHPGFLPKMNALKPQSVKDDEKVRQAGAMETAKKTADEPFLLEQKRVAGEEARKTKATVPGKAPSAAGAAGGSKEGKERATVLSKRIAQNRSILTSANALPKDKEIARQQIAADSDELDKIGSGAKGATVRQVTVNEAVSAVQKAMRESPPKTMTRPQRIKQILDHNVANGTMTQAEADRAAGLLSTSP